MIGARKDVGFDFRSEDLEKTKHFNLDGSSAIHVDVWVEAYDDKRFWLTHLPRNSRYKFFIKTPDEITAPDGKVSTGCDRLFKLEGDGVIVLGKAQIFCLDSDDSFLKFFLPSFTCSKSNRDYIYYTSSYAIENIYLNPLILDRVFEVVTGNGSSSLLTPPSILLKKLSALVFEVVILLYFFEVVIKSSTSPNPYRPKLSKILKSVGRVDCTQSLASCAHFLNVTKSLNKLGRSIYNSVVAAGKSPDYSAYRISVVSAGVTGDNAYLFVRGHCLYEGVINSLLKVTDGVRDREIARVKATYADYEGRVKAIIKQWPDCEHSLKAAYHAIPPSTPFFDATLSRLAADYR